MPVAVINAFRGQKPEVGGQGSDKKISEANLTGESLDPLLQSNWRRIKF